MRQFNRRVVWQALDALSEIGQRALIRAYAHAGRRPEALRQYRTCAEILKRELGVAPDAETQALANEIARSGRRRPIRGRSACGELPKRAAGLMTKTLVPDFPAAGPEQRRRAPSADATQPEMALSAAEHRGGGHAVAQSDRAIADSNIWWRLLPTISSPTCCATAAGCRSSR